VSSLAGNGNGNDIVARSDPVTWSRTDDGETGMPVSITQETDIMVEVSVIGGSGYAGGELVRLLLFHPEVTIRQVTSERYAGKFVRMVHPNLRKVSDMKFVKSEEIEPCDVLFLALPHGVSMGKLAELRDKAKIIIALSSDFRLNNPDDYPT